VAETSDTELSLLPARIRTALRGSSPQRETDRALFAGVPPEYDTRMRRFAPANPLRAAVLIPIVQDGEDAGILLTRRAEDLRSHAGQVSFPGGRCDPETEDPVATALRETEEEIGLARSFIEVIGFLPDHLVISGYQVTPVVAMIAPGYALAPDPIEVADVFAYPLRALFDESQHRTRTRKFPDGDIEVYDLSYDDRNVWGATAGMLMTLYRTVLAGEHL
jgi:8-oxo-dGTP pyrophosphatase MutT (NUDIX family)